MPKRKQTTIELSVTERTSIQRRVLQDEPLLLVFLDLNRKETGSVALRRKVAKIGG